MIIDVPMQHWWFSMHITNKGLKTGNCEKYFGLKKRGLEDTSIYKMLSMEHSHAEIRTEEFVKGGRGFKFLQKDVRQDYLSVSVSR